jgi:cyclic pyranopterin phosphate synthase
MTTNGTLLAPVAKQLREAGIKRLNISLDTLNAEKYAAMTRTGTLRDALNGLEAALAAGFEKIKLNAVLMDGFNDDEIEDLAQLTVKYPVDVRFIELMPMTAEFAEGRYLPCDAVLAKLPQLTAENTEGVARLYRLPDGQGRVGLITPVSDHFCARCDRLRLTADGKVKPCLHSREEFSLKGLDKPGMVDVFKKVLCAKPLWHGELDEDHPSRAGRSMNRIGG